MVNRCVVFGCSNSASLHEFPRPSDSRRRRIWERFVQRTRAHWKLETCRHAHICGKHFSDNDFANKLKADMGYARNLLLKKTALPTIYPTVATDAGGKFVTTANSSAGDIGATSSTDRRRSTVRKLEVWRVNSALHKTQSA